MDDILGFLVLLLLVALVGWVLGIVAFFRVQRALDEIGALRRRLAALAGEPPAAEKRFAWEPPVAERAPQPAPWLLPAAAAAPPVTAEPSSPLPEPAEPPAAATGAPPGDLEALLTQRWGLWLGAAALLLSGVFLIRYAVENALLGPAARCVLAALLGGALLAAAEWLHRRPPAGAAPAALAAGGVAVLFGAAYGAGAFYQLLPPPFDFALLALAGTAGLLASLRYGPLAAAVGITGAFITPLLVPGTDVSVPGLFAYLLVVTAASLAVVRYAAWAWLAWAATVAGAVWVMLAATTAPALELWAPALYVPAAAALFLALLPPEALEHPVGRQLSWVPFGVLGVAGLLLEGFGGGGAARAGVLLLAPLAVWKGWAEPRLDRLPWLAAALFLAVLLCWALPDWKPTGEVITGLEGAMAPVLPGAWAPAVIMPLLLTAAGMAGLFAAAGLLLEAQAPRPLPWAGLAAAVPVLTLVVTYVQVGRFQSDTAWALTAAALAAGLTLAAWRARRADSLPRAGTHAAGAAAALALGCAIVLNDHWLTLAVALFLPPLALIEASADLPPLRRIALVVSGVVLVRLLLNVWVLDYAFGVTPVLNGLLLAYGVPAAAFALAALLFRRRGDDRTVEVLEAGAVAFAVVLVVLELRHGLGGGDLRAGFGFREAALQVAALAVEATLLLRLSHRKVPGAAARILGTAALYGGGLLLVLNPAFVPEQAGWVALLAAYVVPPALALLALRTAGQTPGTETLLGAYATIAGFTVLGLGIRLAFHPGAMALQDAPVEDGELWAYSGAWMLYGAGLMAVGIGRTSRPLRLAALGIIGLVTAKVFLVDMADLAGLWRVLSFLGLGLALIALGAVYRRFVIPAAPPPPG